VTEPDAGSLLRPQGSALSTQRPLKVGIQLPEVERLARWSECAEMARVAEDAGFDSVWVADHLLYRDSQHDDLGPWECWSMLAALAAVTRRVELGPLVACANFHNAAMLAKKAETIDEISGGRLILALGAGWNAPEFQAYGFPYDHRASRFEEAFAIIRGLVREGRVDYTGEFNRAPECVLVPRGPRPQGPEIMIGTRGARMLDLCARYADSWNAWYAWFGNDLARLPSLLAQVDAACEAVGREPTTLGRTCALLVRLPDLPGVTGYATGQATALKGSPEQLAETLRGYAALGVSHVQLVLDPNSAEAIEAVAPALDLLERS
jgi:alkanesulfonate monooxygenase SsuD/methylene tetrahydromethanopterin reductase-like flavin-dependent oxidoreductase (luciferase family)